MGHGGVGGIWHAHALVDDPPSNSIMPIAAYQFTIRSPIGLQKANEFGVIGTAGLPVFSGGAYFRHAIIGRHTDSPLVLGGQVSAGMAWLGVGLPTAIRLSDNTWLTSHPSLRTTVHPALQLPLGLSFRTSETKRIDTEVGAHFTTKDHDQSIFKDSYSVYFGINFAQTLGPTKK